jgi:hypothetical protein
MDVRATVVAGGVDSKILIFQKSRFLKTCSYCCSSALEVVEGDNERVWSALIMCASKCMLMTLRGP